MLKIPERLAVGLEKVYMRDWWRRQDYEERAEILRLHLCRVEG
jgi:hypothetical protein